jgi:NADPH:quinone reductase-like Zn-dependent oxidoreductase
MRAAVYRSTGTAAEVLRIEEVPTPEPDAGQVRVRLAVSGVNPTGGKARSALPAHRYRLDDVAAAHDAVEGFAVGKVLIDVA